jgi:hypothetical protein
VRKAAEEILADKTQNIGVGRFLCGSQERFKASPPTELERQLTSASRKVKGLEREWIPYLDENQEHQDRVRTQPARTFGTFARSHNYVSYPLSTEICRQRSSAHVFFVCVEKDTFVNEDL